MVRTHMPVRLGLSNRVRFRSELLIYLRQWCHGHASIWHSLCVRLRVIVTMQPGQYRDARPSRSTFLKLRLTTDMRLQCFCVQLSKIFPSINKVTVWLAIEITCRYIYLYIVLSESIARSFLDKKTSIFFVILVEVEFIVLNVIVTLFVNVDACQGRTVARSCREMAVTSAI